MSRIGKQLITIPSGVNVSLNNETIAIVGPKGTLSQIIDKDMKIEKTDADLKVSLTGRDTKKNRALYGFTRASLANAVEGVTHGFSKQLELVGTGYRVSKKGNGLSMTLGFSHPVEVNPIEGITFEVEGNTVIKIAGIDKQLVNQAAANIRALKKPEPYKGKGIKYWDEIVRRKPGKQAKATTAA